MKRQTTTQKLISAIEDAEAVLRLVAELPECPVCHLSPNLGQSHEVDCEVATWLRVHVDGDESAT